MNAEILNETSLKRYLRKRKSPWSIDGLIYDRLPMLAVRNYLNSYEDEDEWPLCWESRRGVRLGLTVSLEILKGWQAFRPQSIDQLRGPLGRIVPGIVRRMQDRLADFGVYRAWDLARKNDHVVASVVKDMSLAVARISATKKGKTKKGKTRKGSTKGTPMLGSKVLHFFFPEFFPVWDTGWIKKELKKWSKDAARMPESLKRALSKRPKDRVALEYAHYVCLMLRQTESLSRAKYERLKTICIRKVQRRNDHKLLREVLDDNVYDLSPMLFELCVIGAQSGRRTW